MEWDPQMALDPQHTRRTGMKSRTSDLNEDLGRVNLFFDFSLSFAENAGFFFFGVLQIDHIFSDKTGTLTRNEMLFAKCTVGGKVHENLATLSEDVRRGVRKFCIPFR